MPTPPLYLAAGAPASDVAQGMAAVRLEQGVPEDFPGPVTAAVEAAVRDLATAGTSESAPAAPSRADRTDLPLVTVDPPGSRAPVVPSLTVP